MSMHLSGQCDHDRGASRVDKTRLAKRGVKLEWWRLGGGLVLGQQQRRENILEGRPCVQATCSDALGPGTACMVHTRSA